MFPLNIYKTIKFPIVLAAIGTLIFGFFCASLFIKSPMHMTMTDNTEPMSTLNQQSCCNSGVLHYFDTWKNIVVSMPQKVREDFALLALPLSLIFGSSYVSFLYRESDHQLIAMRFYTRQNPNISLFNNLKLAFARGLLNTKVY